MASASRKARKTFSGLVARTRCKRTVLPWDMTLFSPLLSGVYRRIWLGWLRLCHKDAWPPGEPTWGQKNFRRGARAGSVLGNGRAPPGCAHRHAAGDAHAGHAQPAFAENEHMRIHQGADAALNGGG